MAESMLIAFGRYLRTLRERRGYSLDDVASLTRLSPDPILKGYLSRCENGKTRIGFSKMSTLCQVYEVPLEVVAERHSLDLELERIGGPDTKERSFEDLATSAAKAFKQGRRWEAYGEIRDAFSLGQGPPVMAGFRDAAEQTACTCMNIANIAGSLGKSRFAMHELEHLRSTGGLGPIYHPVLLDRMAARFLFQGNTQKARELSDSAIAEVEIEVPHRYHGDVYFTRALIASYESEADRSIELYQKAYKLFSEAGRSPECANTLMNLAQKYFDVNRLRSARRAIASAERLATSVKHHGVRARARLLLGEIEDLAGRSDEAASRWREASDIARLVNDRILRFKAEYMLYDQATRLGNRVLAAALHRRLAKLSPWVPSHIEELRHFREGLPRASRDDNPGRVASSQRPVPSRRNPSSPQTLI